MPQNVRVTFDWRRMATGLVCEACRLLYEIRDNIPVMLIDEAVSWMTLPACKLSVTIITRNEAAQIGDCNWSRCVGQMKSSSGYGQRLTVPWNCARNILRISIAVRGKAMPRRRMPRSRSRTSDWILSLDAMNE